MKTGLIALLSLLLARSVMALEPIPVILDSDANNELDDQHAIAYLLLNPDYFDPLAITVNRTKHGGGLDQHVAEAERVVALCGLTGKVPVIAGADQNFEDIRGDLDNPWHDGHQAVDLIISEALEERPGKLVLLPVGKLTNIALALEKNPAIADRVRIVWLGSNYPAAGEYNQDNDEGALQYLLAQDVWFEMVTVRYNADSGTTAVRVTPDEIKRRAPGLGPSTEEPVEGRHGGTFRNFGDYSVSLFDKAELYGEPPARSLFDMAAVAILKNPEWAESSEIPAPLLEQGQWQERPYNPRTIVLWENFDRDAIVEDYFLSLERSTPR